MIRPHLWSSTSPTGSRGAAVTILWKAAIDKQMKNEWNELELIVRSLTKLQPHFLTPWLFQSWNLAYNVSVESDRVKDKYFYITRGIELLAQGERLNRDNPDMRRWIGFYLQNKFGVADETNTLRSLYQLSCIDPQEREPSRFRQSGRPVDLTPTEFRLLECLLRQPGRAFTRHQLMDAAIGEGSIVLERTIDVHIKTLRRKLDAPELIETVRGVGYRFRELASEIA